MSEKKPLPSWLANTTAVFIATLITLLVTGGLHLRVAGQTLTGSRAPMPVATTRYTLESGYQREQHFLGLVQAASRSQVGFEVPGAIAEIHTSEGQQVEAGAALATLDTQALQARQRALQATVRQIAAERELASARTERQAPLKNSGAISAQTYDDTRLAEKALTSRLEAAKAQLQALDIDIAKSTLRAPYPARIGRQLLDQGAVTQPGTPIFTLVSSGAREAHIGVSVEQARFLRVGQTLPIAWRQQTVDTVLRAVRPDVNPVSMTTVAIFDLPETIDAFDGEPVSVSLPRTVSDRGGWVPLSALIEGERGVWTVLALREQSRETVALREVVEVLHVSADQAFVRGTLNANDRIIADGVHRIAPGTRVEPLASEIVLRGETD